MVDVPNAYILQVKASDRILAPIGRLVEQPTRAQFIENNQSSSFKVNSQCTLHLSSILYMVCRPGNQWRTHCLTVSPLVSDL